MLAVTFQEPGRVAVEDRPEPEPIAADDAVVRIDASGICGSDLHLFHGRIPLEQGFTLGHEYVGTVVAAGDGVTEVGVGDSVLGTFHSACGKCYFCRMGEYTKCDEARTFGHGKTLGALQGTQAEQALVPHANLTLRRVPEALSNDSALFAGDVMGTGYHAIANAGLKPGDTCAVIGLGPVGLCAVMAARVAGAARVIAIDTSVPERLEVARSLGAEPVHATEEDPRAAVKDATAAAAVWTWRWTPWATQRCWTSPVAWRARPGPCLGIVGVFSERIELHMGVVWIEKNLKLVAGQANVIGHLDAVLSLMAAGRLDPTPLAA